MSHPDAPFTKSPAFVPYLGSLSALAAQSFSSTNALVDAVLSLVATQLGLRTSLLMQITPAENRNHVVAAYNRPGGCDVLADTDLPFDQTF